jgi:S-methylmethionine-dependent homocysteine/selenocysteine methylase
MPKYRDSLPQLSNKLFITDAGLETDIIFNKGMEIREFAAHTLLPIPKGKEVLREYFTGFVELAREMGVGYILDSPTWKAHMHWAKDLGQTEEELHQANKDAVAFVADIRDKYADSDLPIVLNGVIGPRGDAYAPEVEIVVDEAEAYHSKQMSWLAETEVDMVTALTFPQCDEAIGAVKAAKKYGLPIAVSFCVELDGHLPNGQSLENAITAVDAATDNYTSYFMVNCAHPDHFSKEMTGEDWSQRIQGVRCNASRMSHAELDNAEVLDDGDPVELAGQYAEMLNTMPWMHIFGACCGSDIRHVREILKTVMKKS